MIAQHRSLFSAWTTNVPGRSWGETLKFAMRANACADQPPISARSRAGILIRRAANFPRRQCCAGARTPHTGSASSVLTAPIAPNVHGPVPAHPEGMKWSMLRARLARTRPTLPSFRAIVGPPGCLSRTDRAARPAGHAEPLRRAESIPSHLGRDHYTTKPKHRIVLPEQNPRHRPVTDVPRSKCRYLSENYRQSATTDKVSTAANIQKTHA